ncbi:hypothetical protein [Halalkalicoccus jeotgali]|uniref:Uncharacterized protein n=1 Tax=Halalkalicoccus jeotgali (strain DSM 18796 / CECT 7217 / JCM 14584 / KCTC 4019 / B3) TaxID=795797 RepID=D8J9L4_HALJB|nr:hypothetical protein [Halalkalicoccus jeotgali]ADJ14426.1 hypothetical protein HacjB3_05175 [Halalkalicoccus jeotgali B3]ELY40142.1 hypothetical protein C497_03560 [Halalkalicoccus jeotgali B3]
MSGTSSNSVERSANAFTGAFYEAGFERMKSSQHVTVVDWHELGAMSEFDYYVSFRLPTTAVVENSDADKERSR